VTRQIDKVNAAIIVAAVMVLCLLVLLFL